MMMEIFINFFKSVLKSFKVKIYNKYNGLLNLRDPFDKSEYDYRIVDMSVKFAEDECNTVHNLFEVHNVCYNKNGSIRSVNLECATVLDFDLDAIEQKIKLFGEACNKPILILTENCKCDNFGRIPGNKFVERK